MGDVEEFLDDNGGNEETPTEAALKQQLKNLNARLRRRRGNTELLVNEMRDAVADLPPPAPPKRPAPSRKKREEIAVLHLSDWQIGAIGTGTPDEVFNLQVARERILERMLPKVSKIIEARRSGARVNRLIVLWAGDNVDGSNLRADHPWNVESTVMEQACRDCPALLRDLMLALMEMFPSIEVWAVPGNHGRSGSFKGDANPKTVNWDTVATQTFVALMGDLVDGKRLTVHICDDGFVQVVPVGEKKILNLHGHQFSGGGGMVGLPLYGMAKGMAKWSASGAYDFDYMFMGHFHIPYRGTFGAFEFFVNGSIQTGSEYVRDTIKDKGRPAQRLVMFDPVRGPISDCILYLDD